MNSSETEHKSRLIIASGGTGGHFYPTIAVAQAFCRQGGEAVLLVSGIHAEEQRKIAGDYGFEAYEVPSVRLPGRSLVGILAFPWRMLKCIRAARKELLKLNGDILLGMGSFAAYPACRALPAKRLPLVLHEGNSFIGKTNRLLIRKASAIGLSLPLADEKQLHGCRSQLVGMPLRQAVIEAAKTGQASQGRKEYLTSLGLDPERRTILVFGGSQGARAINELVSRTAAELGFFRQQVQFIHLTGTDDNAEIIKAYEEAGITASVRRGEQAIEHCYLFSDLVICRGGASSLCELALFGKPAIIIPLPTAADDHQRINAECLAQREAVCCLLQKDATTEKLRKYLEDWLTNPSKWNSLAQNIRRYAHPEAAENMVKLINMVMAGGSSAK